MPEERDPVYRWVAEHQGWAFVITVVFVLCVIATVAGFAFIAVSGGLGPGPSVTTAP